MPYNSLYLHSTVVLLKDISAKEGQGIFGTFTFYCSSIKGNALYHILLLLLFYLHSTVVLLKAVIIAIELLYSGHLHSTVVLLKGEFIYANLL